jgi:hypothetical protein
LVHFSTLKMEAACSSETSVWVFNGLHGFISQKIKSIQSRRKRDFHRRSGGRFLRYYSVLPRQRECWRSDCAGWWKGSGYRGKTTNQSSKIVNTLSTGTRVIASIAVDELQKVSHNLFMRCEACLQAGGGQFQHLL